MDADKPALPQVVDRPHAPVIYFEGAPALNHLNGVIGLTLTTSLHLPLTDGTGVDVQHTAVAYLRMNIAGARLLQDSLAKALLLATPPENDAKN